MTFFIWTPAGFFGPHASYQAAIKRWTWHRALKHSASIAMCPAGYQLENFIADFHLCRRYFQA